MKSIHDKASSQAILRQLLPQIVGMPGQHGIGPISEMGGERCARAYRIRDLRSRSPGMANARYHALFDDLLDEARSVRPFGRKRHQANVAVGGFLEAQELAEIGRPDPARRMRTAW